VLVKAKKLYPNHLELIKQRVEIIRRGLELKYSRRKIEYLLQKGREQFAAHAETLDAELASFVAELDDGLTRVIAANEPSVMPRTSPPHPALRAPVLRGPPGPTPVDHHTRGGKGPRDPRGTLTDTERKQIESHVVHTFQFLAQIPWTREIRNIPEIARSHHEKLNGSGYPYG